MNKCEELGCDGPARWLGMCKKHYHRMNRQGTQHTAEEYRRIREVLEWVMDGDALTSPAERALYGLDLAA